jgi:phosphohistidine phosphatase
MQLYFFRHGQAGQSKHDDPSDDLRELTPEGIERTKVAAKAVSALGVKPTHIYSSPLTRARQTADIVAKALKVTVEVRPEVEPGFSIHAVAELIEGLNDQDEIMFFGHEPDFSATITQLIGGGEVVMKKGGLARVDLFSRKPLRGALVWLIAPRVFEALGSD